MTATHAPQHPTSYIYAPPVMSCRVCDADTDPRQAAVVEVTRSGDLAVAVVICPTCARRAIKQDGDLEALISDIRESYAHRPDAQRGTIAPDLIASLALAAVAAWLLLGL